MDRLNFFSPFEQLPPNHENQLTRALLVVLRLSPMAHATWLRLVAPPKDLHRLPAASFATQRRAVRRTGEEDEFAELVSVFLAPEEPASSGGVVTLSDRAQVLDAIIDYAGELVVVIENKIAPDDDRQAREINVTGAKIKISEGQEAIGVLWRDVLEGFMALGERGLVGGAEQAVLDEFLTYIEDHFPALGPFRNLGMCGGNEDRQMRRLRQVLGEAVGREAVASYWGPYVETNAGDVIGANAYLKLRDDRDGIELSLYPADTLTQARAFYQRSSTVDALRRLREEPNWDAGPNFHFGHIQRGYCWTCNQLHLDEYLEVWTERIGTLAPIPRSRWDDFWSWLEEKRIACPENRAEFDLHFTNTQRRDATPRPGVWLSHRWSFDDAERLDATGRFSGEVRLALNAALTAFDQPQLRLLDLPDPAAAPT